MRIGLIGARFEAATACFVLALGRRAQVVAARPGDDIQAWLLCDPSVEELERRRDEPVAVWLTHPAESRGGQAAITVAPAGAGEALPAGVIGFPRWGTEVRKRLHLTPFLRSRWRRAAQLPDSDAADLWDEAIPLDDLLRARLLLASVVAARQEVAVEALACGAPLVTDAATAFRLGLSNGAEAVVVDGDERRETMRGLLSDDSRAAALSRRGRRHAEQWLDQGGAADQVIGALTPAELDPAASIFAARLDELSILATADVIADMARCLTSAAAPR